MSQASLYSFGIVRAQRGLDHLKNFARRRSVRRLQRYSRSQSRDRHWVRVFRCRDMGANRGRVDVIVPTLSHRLGESGGHALPDSGRAPAPKSSIDRVPVAVFLRDIMRWCPGAKPPHDAIDDVPVVFWRSSTAALARLPFDWQQNPQNTPLDLCQIAAAQGCLPNLQP
jgi:hypothetical protein